MSISKIECFGGKSHGECSNVPYDRLHHNDRWDVYTPGEIPELFDPTATFEIETYIITEITNRGRSAGFILLHESWNIEKALLEINMRLTQQRKPVIKWKGWY